MRGKLCIQTRLLKQSFVIKVQDKSLMLRIVRVDYNLKSFEVLEQSYPFLKSCLEFLLYQNSLMVIFLIQIYAIIAVKLQGSTIFASFIVAVIQLDISSATTAFHLVSISPITERLRIKILVIHEFYCLILAFLEYLCCLINYIFY